MRRLLVLLLVSASVFGCGRPSPRAALPTLPSAGTTVVVEPDDGMEVVYGWLAAPRHDLDLVMYELVDPRAEQVLADDAARGVHVRVLLDAQRERHANLPAWSYLRAHGVDVGWSSDRYATTHEKAFVVDGAALVVLSLNLTSRYYPTTRDVAVLTRSPPDVAAVREVFEADWRGAEVGTPPGADLVWSPRQAAADFVAFIGSARRSIWLESEEYAEPATLAALEAAARRGVDVHVAMTYQAGWAKGWDRLVRAGGHVTWYQGEHPLYVHAKVVVLDAGTPGMRALTGSQNLSTASLWRDRELGIVLVGPACARLAETLAHDLDAGRPWLGAGGA